MDKIIFQPLGKFACTLAPGPGGDILGFPTWYKYLSGTEVDGKCVPTIGGDWSQLWFIGVAVLEMLLYLAGMLLVAYLIYGGYKFIYSQGNPEQVKLAKGTLLNAVIGIVIIIVATGVVRFVAGRFITAA